METIGSPAPPAPRRRIGVTASPLVGQGPAAALDLAVRAERLGYASFWTAETSGAEAFSLLGAVTRAAPAIGPATGVLPLQLRTPPLLAMAAATVQALAPDREVLLGIGVSSPVVAGDWHGASYPDRPLAHMREFVALLRECLSGKRVTFAGDYYRVHNFFLRVPLPDRRPKIVLAALGAGMLRLAGECADGVLLNYVPASHVPWCVEQVRRGGDATVYANVHVGVGDRDAAAARLRHDLYSYAVVDAYARSFARAGFETEVRAIRAAHEAGDRRAALAAVSPGMLDAIKIVGDEALVRDAVGAYRRAGVDVPVVYPLVHGAAPDQDVLDATLRAAAAAAPAAA
jgi:probable F420-dependent oxidoreductase